MHRGTYNPTSDAVWLAAFAPDTAKTILDVGVGSGGVSLCLHHHNPTASITAVDISAQMLDMAEQNAALNDTTLELISADIYTWRSARTFDLVITNPPYFQGTPAKHNAHHNADIGTWIKKCVARVRPMGTFCMITDAATISSAINAMHQAKLRDINILPLFGAKRTAERVLLSGRLGTRGVSVIHQSLPMNFDPVLRDGLTIRNALSRISQI